MSWVNKHKLPTIEAIKYDNQSCLTLKSLWNTLYSTFNTALYWQIDIEVLDEIGDKLSTFWTLFSKKEFKHIINNCNNLSMLGPDKLSWSHLKSILKQDKCLCNIIIITNACINLGHWPNHFKCLSMVVIPKPNKQSFNYCQDQRKWTWFILFFFSFLFSVQFIFIFSIFKTTRVRADWSRHHISHLMV